MKSTKDMIFFLKYVRADFHISIIVGWVIGGGDSQWSKIGQYYETMY